MVGFDPFRDLLYNLTIQTHLPLTTMGLPMFLPLPLDLRQVVNTSHHRCVQVPAVLANQ